MTGQEDWDRTTEAEKSWQDNHDRLVEAERRGWPEQDTKDRTAGTGQSG
jgi:hypothetical protein